MNKSFEIAQVNAKQKFNDWFGAARQHAFTWANADPDLCHHKASVGHDMIQAVGPLHKKQTNQCVLKGEWKR